MALLGLLLHCYSVVAISCLVVSLWLFLLIWSIGRLLESVGTLPLRGPSSVGPAPLVSAGGVRTFEPRKSSGI